MKRVSVNSKRDVIERIFSSKGKTRLVRVLFKLEEANISRIARATGLHHKLVEKYLLELKDLGIIEEHRYGRLRVFKINYTSPYAFILKQLIDLMESQQG